MIEIVSNPDKKIWENFVYNHPQGNIFQTPEMVEVYNNTKNYVPLTLAAIDSQTDEMTAVVTAALIHEFGGLLKPFTSRAIILGGPLYQDNLQGLESVRLLMEQYDIIAGRSALYTEIRNLSDTTNLPLPHDYTYEEHLNFLIDLSVGKEKLWKNLSQSRRHGITKSKKMGITIKEITSGKELEKFYFIIKDTYKKAHHPLSDKSLFDSAYTHLVSKNLGKIFFAYHENISIAASLLLVYKQQVYAWYRGSLQEYSKFFPNDSLVWHSLEWSSKNNYTIFDFMGAGKPDQKSGIRDFKRQFGGTQVNYGRYIKVHSPIKYWIAQRGLGVYKKVGKYYPKH
jgi:serine/alanine adding enzyme